MTEIERTGLRILTGKIYIGGFAEPIKSVAFFVGFDDLDSSIIDLGGNHTIECTKDVNVGTISATGFASPTITITDNMGNAVDNGSIKAFTWYHVAVTTDTGINVVSASFGGGLDGALKEVSFYETELTAEQIAVLAITVTTRMYWLDTSVTPNVYKRWDGNAWIKASPEDLDDIADGDTYHRVLKTSIEAGKIKLDEVVTGGTYELVLSTCIESGKILLTETTGDLDNIDDGDTYGKVYKTQITAGRVVISNGDCDETIIDGGKIITTLLTADNVQAGTFTGLTFQTAEDGQRIVIDGSNNKLSLFVGAGAGTERVRIDDTIDGFAYGMQVTGSTGILEVYENATNKTFMTSQYIGALNTSGMNVIRGTSTITADPRAIIEAIFNGAEAAGMMFLAMTGGITGTKRFWVDEVGNGFFDGSVEFDGEINGDSGADIEGNVDINGNLDVHSGIDLETGDLILGVAGDIKLNILTASRALYLSAGKEIKTSSVTSDELLFLSGVTSGIQSQINSAVTTAEGHAARHVEGGADAISLSSFELGDLGDVQVPGASEDTYVLTWDDNSSQWTLIPRW